jgi:hypothetical protein
VHAWAAPARLGSWSSARSPEAAAALALFAVAAARSTATASALLGSALVRPAMRRRLSALVPAHGSASLLFGAWYAAAALGGAPYAF